jgi:hypothetical protein
VLITRISLLLLVTSLAACSTKDGYTPGTEGSTCLEGEKCQAGLICLSNLCVQPPRADTGASADGLGTSDGPGSDAGPSADSAPIADGGPRPDLARPDTKTPPKPDLGPESCQRNEDCDDGLACTNDFCGAGNVCSHFVKGSFCLIGGKCWTQDTINPTNECEVCHTIASDTSWTHRHEGTTCDDKNPCTHTDVCQKGTGVCAGKAYSCDDKQGCTKDRCLGDGSCEHLIATNFCFLDNKCVKAGTVDPTSRCRHCDPKQAAKSWTTALLPAVRSGSLARPAPAPASMLASFATSPPAAKRFAARNATASAAPVRSSLVRRPTAAPVTPSSRAAASSRANIRASSINALEA